MGSLKWNATQLLGLLRCQCCLANSTATKPAAQTSRKRSMHKRPWGGHLRKRLIIWKKEMKWWMSGETHSCSTCLNKYLFKFKDMVSQIRSCLNTMTYFIVLYCRPHVQGSIKLLCQLEMVTSVKKVKGKGAFLRSHNTSCCLLILFADLYFHCALRRRFRRHCDSSGHVDRPQLPVSIAIAPAPTNSLFKCLWVRRRSFFCTTASMFECPNTLILKNHLASHLCGANINRRFWVRCLLSSASPISIPNNRNPPATQKFGWIGRHSLLLVVAWETRTWQHLEVYRSTE